MAVAAPAPRSGAAPERGAGAATAIVTVGHNATGEVLAYTFSVIFAVAAGFLLLGIATLVLMEERPLRTTIRAMPAREAD